MRLSIIAASIAASVALSSSVAEAEPITTADVLKIKQVTSIDLSPDASFVVYALRSIDSEASDADEYSYRSNLWMARPDSSVSQPVQLTSGDRSDGSPTISPDGSTLAFVRRGENSEGEPSAQVWLLNLQGPGEARQLTTLEHGAFSPRWADDGATLIVTTAIPMSEIEGDPPFPMERPKRTWDDAAPPDDDDTVNARPDGTREEIRAWLAENAEETNPTVINRIAFQSEQSLRGEDSVAHLVSVDVATAEAVQFTEGWTDYGGARLSPDGSTFAFAAAPDDDKHPDRVLRTSIFLADRNGGNIRKVLDSAEFSYGSPRWLPDGESLAVSVSQIEPDRWGRQTDVGLFRLATSALSILTEDHISSAQGIGVDDSGAIYFRSPMHGAFPMYSVDPSAGGAPSQITTGAVGIQSFDVENGVLVGAVTQVSNPSELYLIKEGGILTRLTNHNGKWLAYKTLSDPEEHWIERPDGSRVQYWVMPPTNARSGVKHPTVLEMHGGPSAMWGPGEFSMWHEFQLLCSWGYGVVYANPRGSSGYGYEFQAANFQDWGFGPQGDVLGALDDASDRYDWIDEDRLFLTGGSYAGYLTAWIVTQDHRFKAAVAQRGVYDLDTFFGEGNAWRLNEVAFGGMPWDPEIRAVLVRESPFTHVANITTPLLIIHSSQDLRTGVSQSEMMYRALKELERPVEYVRYPGAGHDLSRTGDPKQRMDRLNRIVEFFERYAENDRPAPVEIEED